MSTPLPPIRFTVSTLLPQGLSVLAGAPKVGKPWLALQICLAVAKGENLWGLPTKQCSVLYLCLEDSFARIQSRLFDIGDDATDNIHFVIMADIIGAGLEEQIETFLTEHSDTSLIVIDALQKVRSLTNDNAYAADYHDVGLLKAIADSSGYIFTAAALSKRLLQNQYELEQMRIMYASKSSNSKRTVTAVYRDGSSGSDGRVEIPPCTQTAVLL